MQSESDPNGEIAGEPASGNGLAIDLKLKRKDFSLEVRQILPARGVTAVFGRSGSGKTTLLRCIAGFDQGEGRIALDDSVWADSSSRLSVPTHKRGVGYMFQEPRLFPHLSVAGNLRFAQRRAAKAVDRGADAHVVSYSEVVEAFALSQLLERAPSQLSGGEAQRVALARTLLTQPRLLLLDEPLAALDDTHKSELLPFLQTLVRDFDLPILYVSHDVEEVAQLAPQMLVMSAGRVEAFGATSELFERLDIQEVTGRFESGALLSGWVVEHDERWMLTTLTVADQKLSLPMRAALRPGDQVRLRIRARDVAVAIRRPEGLSIRNILSGVVQALHVEEHSAFAEVTIELAAPATEVAGDAGSGVPAGSRIRARITRAAVDDLAITLGMPIFALVKSVTFDS